jgi:stress-induced morphogen
MESIDLSTENPLDGSFLDISLEETVHTTKYDSYQCDICQKKFKSQQNLKRHLKIHDGTNILIQSNLFKRSNFQGISQFIHLKDISKVNDNGN